MIINSYKLPSLNIKIFSAPLYRKWIELYAVVPRIKLKDYEYVYIYSVGEKRFIEYIYDHETMKALELSVPPHLTRLGYLLLKNGFLG